MKARRILICGGGIAGLTLAYWLDVYGGEPVVVERALGLRRDGYVIDFFGTGFDVARRMGLTDRLVADRVLVDEIVYVDKRGKRIAALPVERIRRLLNGTYVPLMHQTLERTLYDAVRQRVTVHFGRTVTDVHCFDDGVAATFDDGSSDRYDFIVGADGVHSPMRALVMGGEQKFRRLLGYAVASYRLPDSFNIGRTWTMHAEPGRVIGAYGSDEPGSIFTFFLWRTDDPTHVPRDQRLRALSNAFADANWIASELLGAVDDSTDIFMDSIAQIRMPIWSKDRVVFVGDACGCPTLVSGQGASLAMGGAYVLADALREKSNIRESFDLYERRMRTHVEAQQRSAKGFAKSFVPDTALGVAIQEAAMRILFSRPFTSLLGRQFAVKSFLPNAGVRSSARRS